MGTYARSGSKSPVLNPRKKNRLSHLRPVGAGAEDRVVAAAVVFVLDRGPHRFACTAFALKAWVLVVGIPDGRGGVRHELTQTPLSPEHNRWLIRHEITVEPDGTPLPTVTG